MNLNNNPIENVIRSAFQQLSQNSFAIFKTGITEEEAALLNSVGVSYSSSWDNFGDLNSLDQMLETALADQDQSDSKGAKIFIQVISRLVYGSIQAAKAQTGWVTLRSFATEATYTPRWHRDGRFFIEDQDPFIQQKTVFALRGKASLFTQIPQDKQKLLDEAESSLSKAYAAKNQDEIVACQGALNALIDPSSIISPEAPFEGGAFNVGDPEYAAWHSEPEIDSSRWFLSIVPGSRDQILQLQKRWRK